jgi:hypothetical protein
LVWKASDGPSVIQSLKHDVPALFVEWNAADQILPVMSVGLLVEVEAAEVVVELRHIVINIIPFLLLRRLVLVLKVVLDGRMSISPRGVLSHSASTSEIDILVLFRLFEAAFRLDLSVLVD